MWKAGQIVTLNGKKYRVHALHVHVLSVCLICKAANEPEMTPCRHEYKEWMNDIERKLYNSILCHTKLPKNCYLRRLKPKLQ